MGFLHCVGSGEVVVLAGVDDYTCEAVDDAAHELVHECALHVDVAEQDAVECVVEHDIETFEGTHCGDFRHTEAGAVVAEADVATHFLAHFVEGFAHDAEVLLRCERAAEAFGGSAVRHIVEEALSGGADNCDDVGALTGSRLSLHHIFIDVAGGHDYVKVWFRTFADGFKIMFLLFATVGDALDGGIDVGFES